MYNTGFLLTSIRVLVKHLKAAGKKGAVIALLLQTLTTLGHSFCGRLIQSLLQGVELLHHERWQPNHHPPISHHLHCVKCASQDRADLPDQFIECRPVSS